MSLRKNIVISSGQARRRGFTLIEAAITTVIIGVGCVAMLQLLAAGTMANGEGAELTNAMHLAGNVRECMAGVSFSDPTVAEGWGPEAGEGSVLAYDDVDDFDGSTFDPPINARRIALGSRYSGWSQSVQVQSVDPDNFLTVIPHMTLRPDLRPTSRVTVTVRRNGKTIYSQTWIASYKRAS
jgi:prepilin-type N-terminal cleavage/methylation domain-containing protein